MTNDTLVIYKISDNPNDLTDPVVGEVYIQLDPNESALSQGEQCFTLWASDNGYKVNDLDWEFLSENEDLRGPVDDYETELSWDVAVYVLDHEASKGQASPVFKYMANMGMTFRTNDPDHLAGILEQLPENAMNIRLYVGDKTTFSRLAFEVDGHEDYRLYDHNTPIEGQAISMRIVEG